MNAHTPGPWEAERVDQGVGARWFNIRGGRGRLLAIEIASAANARLIAAAPEMLAMLKDAVCYACARRHGDVLGEACAACRPVRAVLSRIDGAA